MSALLTEEMVEAAVAILRPGIESLIKSTNRMVVWTVVLDPGVTRFDATRPSVLWSGGIGELDQSKWPRKYDLLAGDKVGLTWRTDLPSHLVQRDAPYLFRKGDFKYGGSEYRNGLIVGSSGLEWHHDYLVSASLAAMLQAMTIGVSDKIYPKDNIYIE
ncbi:MAG: hypothetical protein Q8Q03_00465 [bacterium]|nr:hypothetical protein [bacterium]